MSKASKKRASERSRKEKAAAKAAKAALYASYRDSGRTKGSKRAVAKNKNENKVAKAKHSISPCGNQGCMRCYGVSFAGFIDSKGIPRRMPQWLYIIWKREHK